MQHQNLVIDTKEEVIVREETVEPKQKSQPPLEIQEEKTLPQNIDTISNMADTNTRCEGNKIEAALPTSDKDYNEEKEFQKASKVCHRIKYQNLYLVFNFLIF